MSDQLRLLAVLAHPDDESLGNGGTLARYAAEGVEVYLITATRGERGWFSDPLDNPGPEALGKIRESELRAAAAVLGIRDVYFLDYRDGELDRANANEATASIAERIRRIRPHVVLTFDPTGFYGHPDHVTISRFTASAVALAANPSFNTESGLAPHSVSKFYYMAWTQETVDCYETVFGRLEMEVDGTTRRSTPWPAWAITTQIDTRAYWRRAWEAIACHRSQLPGYQKLLDLPEAQHELLWGGHRYYRVYGPTDNTEGVEEDLFAGLRSRAYSSPEPAVAARR